MYNSFNFNAERSIESCGFCYFKLPSMHPDRTLSNIYDIVYMTEGEWGIGQENESYLLRKDQVLILSAGLHHYPVKSCLPNSATMFVHIFREDGDSLGAEDNGASLPSLIDCRDNPRIKKMFEDIIIFSTSPSPHRNNIISSMVRLLLYHLADIVHPAPDSDPAVFRALKIIKQNPSVFFNEAELAELTGVSDRTIRSRFIEYFGKTPRMYQMDEKLAQVKYTLTDRPAVHLRELAENFGFCDEYYLSRCFRNKYGIPPGKYREQSKKEN